MGTEQDPGSVSRPEKLKIDHIAIAASSVEAGLSLIRDRLGVEMPPGGAHPRMGTHNHLMCAGKSIFLEVISIDPHAPAPDRPRWFALDDLEQHRHPHLAAWVAGTTDIHAVLDKGREVGIDLGRAVEMTRGNLRWLISIRDDGALPEGGTLPVIIQWPEGAHPSSRMTDHGVRLKQLRLNHPDPERLTAWLTAIGAAHLADVSDSGGDPPGIEAVFQLPDGANRTL